MRRGSQGAVGALAVLALLLSGCSKPKEEAAKPTAVDRLVKLAARFETSTPDEIAKDTAQLSYDVERPLLTFGGLEAKLGGEQATNEALLALMLAYKARLSPIESQARLMKASWHVQVVNGGEGPVAVAAKMLFPTTSMDASDSETTVSDPASGSSYTARKQGDVVTVDGTVKVQSNGLFGTIAVHAAMNLCPDPAGRVQGNLTIKSSITDGAGTGVNTDMRSDVGHYFNDDATIEPYDTARLEMNYQAKQSAFEKGKGGWLDVSSRNSRGGDGQLVGDVQAFKSFNAELWQAKLLNSYGQIAAAEVSALLKINAQKHVDAGRCVNLGTSTDPDKRSGAEPGTRFTIEAMPRAKSDGAMAAGTVFATLQGEGDLFEGGQKKRADAQFFYTAPKQKGQSGHILLESRSRRGVGKATVDVDTRQSGWRTTMSAVLLWPGGTICDPTRPFQFTDGQTTTTFNPEGDGSGGTFSLKTRQPFGSGSGGGSYRLHLAEDGRSGTLSVKGRVVFAVAGRNSPAAPIATDYPLEPTVGGCH